MTYKWFNIESLTLIIDVTMFGNLAYRSFIFKCLKTLGYDIQIY